MEELDPTGKLDPTERLDPEGLIFFGAEEAAAMLAEPRRSRQREAERSAAGMKKLVDAFLAAPNDPASQEAALAEVIKELHNANREAEAAEGHAGSGRTDRI
jgi:hypothetical protein